MVDTQAPRQERVRMISMVFRQDSMTFSLFLEPDVILRIFYSSTGDYRLE